MSVSLWARYPCKSKSDSAERVPPWRGGEGIAAMVVAGTFCVALWACGRERERVEGEGERVRG